jgi:DNA processing protein
MSTIGPSAIVSELPYTALTRSDARYPAVLGHLDDPPPTLHVLGSLERLASHRVAIVGTRRASRSGREVAAELGHDLAEAGVCVVSGLARGIDAAAHRGALADVGGAAPLAVVGSGLDVVYPAEHRSLWLEVARCGAVVSEHPWGTPPLPHHFLRRNRLIAAFADVVVVVESAARGGSLVTARLALDLGRSVVAVPGSVRSPSCRGSNLLLRDGAAPVLDAGDVLDLLGLARAAAGAVPIEPPADPTHRRVGAALADGPASAEALADQLGLSPVVLAGALDALASAELADRSGLWWELTARGEGVEW